MKRMRWGAALAGIVALAGVGRGTATGADDEAAEAVLARKGLVRSGNVYLLPKVDEAFHRLGLENMKLEFARRRNELELRALGEMNRALDESRRGPGRGPGLGGDVPPMPPPDGGFPGMPPPPPGGPMPPMGGPGFGPGGRRGGPDRGGRDDERQRELMDELAKLDDDELVARLIAGKAGIERLDVRDRREVSAYLFGRLLDRYNRVAADAEVKAALKELNEGRSQRLAVGPPAAYETRIVMQAAETLREKSLRINKGAATFSLTLDDDLVAGVKELDQAWKKLGELEKAEARAEAKLEDLVRQRKETPRQAGQRKAIDAAILKAKAEGNGPRLAEIAAQRARFLKLLRDVRKTAEEAERRRETVLTDPQVKEALAVLDRYRVPRQKHRVVLGKKLDGPRKRLAALEDAVESSFVPLDADRGMFWVAAAVDDSPNNLNMIVDPKEPFVRLSARTAAAVGLRLGDAVEVDVRGRDGRTVRARRVTLGTLRVGPSRARGVACLVLPEAVGDPPPVLGASFLDHFVAEVDSAAGRLNLARVDVGQAATEAGAKP
jgi:predicted aspartyl protease